MAPLESPESSSPIITRAVAAGLAGRRIRNYEFPAWQKALLLVLGGLPQGAARFAISRFQQSSGLPPQILDRFSIETLVRERLNDYAHLTKKAPAVTLGAGLGGPSTYLSLALQAPFLPQAFVVTLKGGARTGNVHEYLARSRERALQIAARDERLMTIQHFDPVHDGWLTRWVNHLRFKLLSLPDAYKEFIRNHLEPGGTLVFLDGRASWLRYRLGPRSVFQVGGWGGIPAEEFLSGSERLRTYARSCGLSETDWALPDLPLETGPESEWGSESDLIASAESFCRSEGFIFTRISLPHPQDFSRLAFATADCLLKKDGRPPAGTSIEMFSQFDAGTCLQTGLLPLWLIFNTSDSLEFLKRMLPEFPPEKPVFFSPLATFSLTPDMVPWKDWQEALAAFPWINTGARKSHYPADARALVRWDEPLEKWLQSAQKPVQSRLTAEDLVQLADSLDRAERGQA